MIEQWRKALVLAPHTDDGEFGCGGTMARLAEAGAEVRQIAFSIASRSLPEGFAADTLVHESRAASDALGLATLCSELPLRRWKPAQAPGAPQPSEPAEKVTA